MGFHGCNPPWHPASPDFTWTLIPWSAMAQTWNVSDHDWKLMKQNSSLMPHKCPGEAGEAGEPTLSCWSILGWCLGPDRDDSGMKRHITSMIFLAWEATLVWLDKSWKLDTRELLSRPGINTVLLYLIMFYSILFLKTIHFKESSGILPNLTNAFLAQGFKVTSIHWKSFCYI